MIISESHAALSLEWNYARLEKIVVGAPECQWYNLGMIDSSFNYKDLLESLDLVLFKTDFSSLSSNLWFPHILSINPSLCVYVSQDSFCCLLP